MDLSRLLKSPASSVLCLFAASRLGLFCVGLLSSWLLPSVLPDHHRNLVWHEPAPRALEIWARWDSEWYLLIAEQGYRSAAVIAGEQSVWEGWAVAGFFPVYPVMVRLLAPVTGAVAAGIVISNLSLLLGLLLLERLARLELGDDVRPEAPLVACLALLTFPTSLFLSAVYPESLFLALSVGCFLCLRTGRFAPAGALGACAVLTRPFGLLLAIPFAIEWWAARRSEGSPAPPVRARFWDLAWIAPMPAALVAYMVFCHRLFRDPIAFVHHKTRWRGAMSGPWQAFVRWWDSGPVAHGSHGSTLELIVAVVCVGGLVLMARRLRPSYTLYTASAMALALGSTLWSFSRLALTLFPLFLVVGALWHDGRRCVPIMVMLVGGTVAGFLMALFANWWWAG